MKRSYSEDPDLLDDVFELLDVVFPGIREGADHARSLGARWESVSTPFVFSEGRRILSHVGVIGLSMIVAGRAVSVGSVHAVATHPEYRRRGHFRALMDEVLPDCEERFDALVLTTEDPEYYEPFGFRVVPEHRFEVRARAAGDSGRLRRLDASAPRDVELLHRLLTTRAPVSEVVGVVDEVVAFFFNEGTRPLWYAEDLDALFCFDLDDGKLALFDVVAREVPPLSALLERVGSPVEEVVVHFAPDRLAVEAKAIPRVLDLYGPSILMVRGPFAAEDRPFTLPRSART